MENNLPKYIPPPPPPPKPRIIEEGKWSLPNFGNYTNFKKAMNKREQNKRTSKTTIVISWVITIISILLLALPFVAIGLGIGYLIWK